MDLSPMNLQVMVPKSTEVGQIQHMLNQQANIEQTVLNAKDQKDMQDKLKQVRTREEAQEGKIKDNLERGGNGKGYHSFNRRHSEENDDEETKEKMAVDIARGQRIDIKF